MTLLSAFASVLLSLPTANAVAPGSQLADFPEVQVPFGCGLVFPVSQGHDVGSHTYNDVYAWDFRMPEGVPIVAASDGVVRMARGDSTVGGCDPSYAPYANYVVVNHGNGYETQYLHFRDVIVKVGDVVKAGDLLGFSGKTGWACGSHLHFKVARPDGGGWNNPSVPARINGYGDPTINTVIAAPACRPPEIQMAKNGTNAELKSAEPSAVPPSPGTSVVQSATGASPGAVMPASGKQAEPAKASTSAKPQAPQASQPATQPRTVTSI
jgi:murein DD-endopeptidase MepM/ murein hydrolase activator NlpD